MYQRSVLTVQAEPHKVGVEVEVVWPHFFAAGATCRGKAEPFSRASGCGPSVAEIGAAAGRTSRLILLKKQEEPHARGRNLGQYVRARRRHPLQLQQQALQRP